MNLERLIAQAEQVASARRTQRAEEARARARIEKADREWRDAHMLLVERDASAIEMDNCEQRDPSVRGMTPAECQSKCRLEHAHKGKPSCVYTILCYRCGKVISSDNLQRKWCSNACSTTWWDQHFWGSARWATLKRDDYTCVRCGRSQNERPEVCGRCDTPWPCDPQRHWMTLPDFAPGRNIPGHWPVKRSLLLEVNHIVPLVGRGYHTGCVHHAVNLETCCHSCHVAVTTQQRRDRSDARLAARVRALGLIQPGLEL